MTAPRDAILVINAGSSSLKFSVFGHDAGEDLTLCLTGQISGIGTDPVFEAKDAQRHPLMEHRWPEGGDVDRSVLLRFLLDWLGQTMPNTRLVAAGHRVVHGGEKFTRPVRLTSKVLRDLEALVPMAPLHQPHNIMAVRALADAHPHLIQVACFDTAFHRTMPWQAETYALPADLTEQGIRRYGFHGLSYEYISRHLAETAPALAKGKIVVAHLGNGASLSAIDNGRCVDTTMGFSTLDGVPMGTRPGAIDPGILLYLMREKGYGIADLERLLYRESGLLGASGVSNDMRVLLECGDAKAEATVDLFCHRVAKEIAAMAASMGGIDGLVFTAGIGEHSAPIRQRVCDRLAWLGIAIDPAANLAKARAIASCDSAVPVLVIPTDEERMIASHTLSLLEPVEISASAP